jgi:hypothetical protein
MRGHQEQIRMGGKAKVDNILQIGLSCYIFHLKLLFFLILPLNWQIGGQFRLLMEGEIKRHEIKMQNIGELVALTKFGGEMLILVPKLSQL